MTNQIQFSTFNFHSNAVRVITDPTGEFWFCGKDVCSILGYVNESLTLQKHCKKAGVSKRYLSYPSGRKEAIFINEPNLYRLIIKSRKPEAEPFETWVFEEVLPQIRKTGSYALQNTQQNPPLVPKDLLDIAMRLKAYAVEYGRFQQSISSTAHDPKAQNDFIASAFSTMNDESYLFVFKPNIKRDLELAEQLLFKYATQ